MLERFGLVAERTLFIDDTPANVAGAEAIGMVARHFVDAATFRRDLQRLGFLSD